MFGQSKPAETQGGMFAKPAAVGFGTNPAPGGMFGQKPAQDTGLFGQKKEESGSLFGQQKPGMLERKDTPMPT